ncbi:MAG: alpha/beta hydrolase [Pseudomonadota bacterium]
MDIILFILSLFLGGAAYNLWRPVYTPPTLASISFLFGFGANLFALHLFLECLLFIGLFAWLNVYTSTLDIISITLLVISAVAFLVFHLRGYNAQDEVERALTEGLGKDYTNEVGEEFTKLFAKGVSFKTMLWPFPQDLPGVEIIKDIAYGSHPIQKLDIYRKQSHGQLRPVLLQIHGGAWTEKLGSKNEQARPLMNHMALRDWVCVSTGYRLSPSATLPDHIIDVKSALIWVKENIEAYGGDPNFIIATGGSAGGHLCSLLALSANDVRFQPDRPEVDTTVQGCVPYYGAVDVLDDSNTAPSNGLEEIMTNRVIKQSRDAAPELWESISPMRRVDENAPPFFVICGDKDTLVPVASNAAFAQKLREHSKNSVSYAQIADAQHAFDMTRTPHSEFVVQGIERWLAHQYSNHLNRAT